MSTKKDKPARKLATIEDLRKKYAEAVVDVRELAKHAGFRSTGSPKLDRLLGGGFARGKMVELWGKPQSSKSTIAYSAAGVCLREGGKVALFDLERGIDVENEAELTADQLLNRDDAEVKQYLRKRRSWLRKHGVDPFHENFHVYDPENGEEMFAIIGDIVAGSLYDIVIVDSVAAIVTRAEMAGDPGESHYGQVAKLLSTELRRLERLYKGNGTTTVIFINQVRDKIGYMAKGQKSTGGNALEHFVGQKIQFTKIGRVESDDDVITEIKVQVNKSRFGSARQETLYVSSMRGLDVISECLDIGLDFKYIHQSGAWYYLFNRAVSDEEFKQTRPAQIEGFEKKVNGKDALLQVLDSEEWTSRLIPLVKAIFAP